MYCGHVAIALAAKSARLQLPLWALLFASFGPDWVETAQIACGVDHTPLWSHSVPAVALGAVAAGLGASVWRRSSRDGALIAGVYVSHLLVDFITGSKPLGFGGRYVGAQLYSWPKADFAVESTLIVVGWLIYRRSLPARGSYIDQWPSRRSIELGLPTGLIALQAVYDRFFAHG